MAKGVYSREAFVSATKEYTKPGERATLRGEQEVRRTGKLNPLVDPAEYGVVRPSRMRFEERPDGLFVVSNGAPASIEYRLDVTTSMGDNVDRAHRALPDLCELTAAALPGRDPFYCASVFGDIVDTFVLCRGQFEVLADRMVNQLTLMHPDRGGGDIPEDPHYGFFGAAFLIRAYLQLIGLRTYDFTITDAPAHDRLSVTQLKRIFGPEVFEKAKENGHDINPNDLPTNPELVAEMLKRTHGFMLLVTGRGDGGLKSYWSGLFGAERVVVLPRIEVVPHVMATIIGLTEGTLDLRSAADFLKGSNITKAEAQRVVDAVAHIPLGAQCALPNFGRMPKKDDVFAKKTDLWPIDPKDLPQDGAGVEKPEKPGSSGGWL